MSKVLVAFLVLALGLVVGMRLALGTHPPEGVAQSWDHVKAEAQQIWGNAQLRISEAQLAGRQGVPGPGLLDRVMTPFAAFGAGVQRFWLNMGINIRPRYP